MEASFEPSTRRAVLADQRMHMELAASLEHLAEATEPADPDLAGSLARFSAAIRKGRKLKPLVFRSYYLLVQDLVTEDLASARTRLQTMEAMDSRSEDREVTYFGHPDGDSVSLELISDGMRIAPISETVASDFSALLDEGFDLMGKALPELAGEISAIVKEVLLARAPKGDKMEFDGASHYQFWGLLMLNPKHHKTPLEIVEVLAHEASHSLLFGLTVDEPLVFNPDDELFESPLRIDLRPMDGIYHATYVSARMCWAMENLAESGYLNPAEKEIALKAAESDRDNYAKGISVVDAHGKLSDTGAQVMDNARNWISAQ